MRNSFETPARHYAKGIGDAVADRTVNRKIIRKLSEPQIESIEVPRRDDLALDHLIDEWCKSNGRVVDGYGVTYGDDKVVKVDLKVVGHTDIETWEDVAYRVAYGNVSLQPTSLSYYQEFESLHHHLRQASLLMSGRHLQHGDETQPTRNMEVFTNCATSAFSFLKFYLLLNGSGVGRCYDDDMMLVDWRNLPITVPVIDMTHKDVQSGEITALDLRTAKHLYDHREQIVFEVPDSREGWAKALEKMEVLAHQGIHRNKVLLLDFSKVRPRGAPIAGMQNRPASGPGPLMNAIKNIAQLRDAGMEPWRSTMFADHYQAECVLVGGARRAARMATKTWRDKSVLEFISLKRGGFLWSSNNSVTVDEEFWRYVNLWWEDAETFAYNANELAQHAVNVFVAVCQASYHDGTGEPGLINVDKLVGNEAGLERYLDGDFAESERYKLDEETKLLGQRLARAALAKPYKFITNPCVTADTWVQTAEGPRQVAELINRPFVAIVNGKPYRASGFWKTGEKPVFRVKTTRGYEVRATADHKILVESRRARKFYSGFNVETEWVAVQDLEPGDKLVLNDLSNGLPWGEWDEQQFDRGWLLGEVVGDGGHNPEKYSSYVRFWGESQRQMANRAQDVVGAMTKEFGLSSSIERGEDAPKVCSANGTITVAGRAIDRLAEKLVAPGKTLLPALEKQPRCFTRGFLRGLFDADGSVQGGVDKGVSVRLWQNDAELLKTVQRMLHRLGIVSTIYFNRTLPRTRSMPDGNGGMKSYDCEAGHELVISKDNVKRFADHVGFYEPAKHDRLNEVLGDRKRSLYQERFTAEVEEIVPEGVEVVYDCTVDDVHRFDANGIIVHNCGEIALFILGGYCVIADVVPYHAGASKAWDDEAEDAFVTATRALIRVNLMDSMYKKEVQRTNRIGVGFTGFHEWAWARFGFGWKDLIDEKRSKPLWLTLSRFKRAIVKTAAEYSAELGLPTPHTDTTVKPAGTTSKLFGLTEGAHLPSMREYLRWVQFRNDDPLIDTYRAKGYPVKKLQTYSGTTVVGFPTQPEICRLGMGDKLVTAAEATPDEQYQYLRLLEKYWIRGVEEDGVTLLPDTGNQVSYTLKYNPAVVSFEEFQRTLLLGQSTVKCCSVMPQTDTTAYEYVPEEPVSKAKFELIAQAIKADEEKEDVAFEHVDCAGGACPINFGDKVQ